MKTPIDVDRPLLVQCIEALEASKVYTTHQKLYKEVAALYNVKTTGKHISPSVVFLRIKQWNLIVKTPKGRKITKGGVQTNQPRLKRSEKFIGDKTMAKGKAALVERWGKKKPRLVKKILEGSLRGGLDLLCYDCSGEIISEVSKCVIFSCPIWTLRSCLKPETNNEEVVEN